MGSEAADARDDLRLASALAESAVAIGLLRGHELLVAYANPALHAWWGWPLGVPLREAPAAEATQRVSQLAEQVIDGAEVSRDPEIPAGDGRFVSVTCSPTRSSPTPAGSVVDGVLVVAV
ncbi:MAG: PAS domain-containing protein, partial [Sporichthyaceae bacterium]|nr:PAS domain-containing protein [Sporichthyaceae bacterium]